MSKLCAFVKQGNNDWRSGLVTLGCPALAAPGSDYCAAHRDLFSGKAEHEKRPPVKRRGESDDDKLPWEPEDWQHIEKLRPFRNKA